MKERTELTMQSSWEEAFVFLMVNYFKEKEVEEFLKEQASREFKSDPGLPDEPDLQKVAEREYEELMGAAHVESYQSLFEFLNSHLVQKRLKDSWQYESSEQFIGRDVPLALSETMGHGLALISEEADIFLHRNRRGYFSGKSPEEVEQIGDRARLLIEFLLVELKSKVSPME